MKRAMGMGIGRDKEKKEKFGLWTRDTDSCRVAGRRVGGRNACREIDERNG